MKQLILLSIIALASAVPLFSQNSNSDLKHTRAVTVELGLVDGYLEHLPPGYAQNPNKKYPLIVYLHGTGERGNGSSDLYKIAKVGDPSRRAEENGKLCFTVNGSEECFIVISPQLNHGTNWTAGSQQRFWEHVIKKAGYRIDLDRVYLTGHSLGGNGVWEAAYSDFNAENMFAAIAPLSYWSNTSKVCNVSERKIPIWAFCGQRDGKFINQSRAAINVLKNCDQRDQSVEIKFTEVPNAGHSITGPTYRVDHSLYKPNLYEWLLTKRRGKSTYTPTAPDAPGAVQATTQSSSSIQVRWDDKSSNEDGFIIERSEQSGANFKTVGSVDANKSTYTDNGLSASSTYYYKLRAYNGAGKSGYSAQTSATTASVANSSSGGAYIDWTNIHGATKKGNDLEKTAAHGWGNSGAESAQRIEANADGWIEMVIQEVSRTDLVFGLSDNNTNDQVTSTDYGFELSKYNNACWVRENSSRRYLGTYTPGDVLKIERSGSKILYKKNGKVIEQTSVSSRPALMADVTLLSTGATVFKGKISTSAASSPDTEPEGGFIKWVNINGAVQNGTNLEKTTAYGWGNSGAESDQSIPSNTDGWIEMEIKDDSKTDLVFGLSERNVNDNVGSTDYGFELSKYNGAFWKRENGDRKYLGTYKTGDVLRVERSVGTIEYKKNGNVIAKTNVSSRPALKADVALLSTGATVFGGRISSSSSDSQEEAIGNNYIHWININGAKQDGNDLEKTAGYGWGNSGAESSQSIPSNSDGWIDMVIKDDMKTDLVFGLSDVNVNDHLASTDYGFELSKYNRAFWKRENGDRKYLGTYKEGDVLSIARTGSTIVYLKNGVPLVKTSVSSRPALKADVALLHKGARVFSARISTSTASKDKQVADASGFISWVKINGASKNGNDLQKTAKYGWGNSGAESSERIAAYADGWAEVVVKESGKADFAFGLSTSNADDRPESINYGFEVSKYNKAYWKRENSSREYLGTYTNGDVLRVERKGSNIIYSKNGTVVATTSNASTASLLADVSIVSTDAMVWGARMSTTGDAGANARSAENTTVSEVPLEEEVLVYPNPVGQDGRLNIKVGQYELGQEGRFLLYDMSGVLVLDEAINSQTTEIALQNLAQSMYAYKLVLDGQKIKGGLIKR